LPEKAYAYLDDDGVVGGEGDVGDVGAEAHPGGGEGDGEEHVDEEVEVGVPDPELLEHLPEVKQRARDLRDEQARHHLRPALQPPQRPPPAGQSMRSSASN
jgi:hypothetical protein